MNRTGAVPFVHAQTPNLPVLRMDLHPPHGELERHRVRPVAKGRRRVRSGETGRKLVLPLDV